MQFIGNIENISIDYETKRPKIIIALNERGLPTSLENLKNDKLYIEIKKYREKRTLDSNSYCWVLCDKIAKELSNESIVTKEQVYKDAILQVGTFEPFIVQENSFDKFKRIWEKQGLGFLVQEVSRKDKCVKVHCYYGSSTYDKKEMWHLIQILVDLAQSLNIETMQEQELKSLLNE